MENDKITTQLVILGGGPAGYVAAIRAAQLGAQVVLIEENQLGGVCLNKGCIPTKALLKTSDIYYSLKKSREFGITISISDVNWEAAYERKNRVVKNLNMGLEHLLQYKGIRVLKGFGHVKSPNSIIVSTPDSEIEVICEKMIITSGSAALKPNIKGIELDNVLTSDGALKLTVIPESLAIIGAGAIGLEFATLFASLGTKITIIEVKDRILPGEDIEISGELLKIMKRQGIIFKLSSIVSEIRKLDDSLEIEYSEKGKENKINAQMVLVAAGRKLNADAVEIKNLKLQIENGAIKVNDRMETSVKDIYAAGDIVGGKLLAHLAFMEGKVAAENALGIKSKIDYNAIPSCVYTNPEVASVGINEDEAKKLGVNFKVGRFNFRNNGRALTLSEREGFVKVIIDDNNVIIGGQILGYSASEMISELTLAITLKAKADVIADTIHPHPSLSEAVWEACADAIGRSIHKQ